MNQLAADIPMTDAVTYFNGLADTVREDEFTMQQIQNNTRENALHGALRRSRELTALSSKGVCAGSVKSCRRFFLGHVTAKEIDAKEIVCKHCDDGFTLWQTSRSNSGINDRNML